ncbi:MAG: AraC family transcriptional regulator [Bacteroidaceae bacterium]|nr:AraC family transcriptional regulator [Bacteroidaceae bacterium]
MKKEIDALLIKSHKYRDPDYSATRLAEDLGIENYKLSRIIKKEYGCTYSDIVLSHRVADAKRHLTNKKKADMTVEEIGILVGFKNRVSFFLAFKRFTGLSPEEYRRGPLPTPTKGGD